MIVNAIKYSAILLLVLITSTVLVFAVVPEKTHAQVGCIAGAGAGASGLGIGAAAIATPTGLPTQDRAAASLLTANLTANAITAGNSISQNTVTCILNGLAWTVAKLAVQSITRSTVNWINSGFNGSPAFVSDLQANLQGLSDAVAENFFQNLNKTVTDTTGFNIKSPFQDQLNTQLRAEYYKTTGSWGLNYNLYQQSTDPQAFIKQGEFAKGGFNAWFSASQNPSNNPFGAYIQASNALWASVDAAAQQRKSELDWGKGFLPWRGGCSSGNTVTTKIPEGTVSTALPSVSVNLQGDSASVSLSKAEPCPFNSVKTPGSVIESQLEKNLGSGVEQLNLADSINEVVGALMGQLVNQVLGPNGLLGTSQPSSGGGSSYIAQATSPSQLSPVTTNLATGVLQSIQNDQTNIGAYRDNSQHILDAATGALTACGPQSLITNTISSTTAAVEKANAALTQVASIQTEVSAAANNTSSTQSTQITKAISDYESYLSSSAIPSAADEADALAQSQDTSSTDTATSTPSLYTRLVNLQSSCTISS